jgi:hypothetical protein
MPCIDFTAPPWGGISTGDRACGGSALNTFTDGTNGLSFIIASGSMNITSVQGNRMLFFSTVDCDNHTVHSVATLIIRFTAPKERVTLRLGFDEHGTAPAVVNFYRQMGNPDPSNLVASRTVEWNGNQFSNVVYDNCCLPIQEITIRTDRPENSLDDLCWGLSLSRRTFLGRAVCLCIARRALDWLRLVSADIRSLFRQPDDG